MSDDIAHVIELTELEMEMVRWHLSPPSINELDDMFDMREMDEDDRRASISVFKKLGLDGYVDEDSDEEGQLTVPSY